MPVAGTQRVITPDGPAAIKTLSGRRVRLWDGEAFAETEVAPSPQPERTLRVALTDGTVVHCTPDHLFHVPSLARGRLRRPVRAGDLRKGVRLARLAFPVLDPPNPLPEAYAQGVYSACGRDGLDIKTLVCANAVVALGMRARVGETVDVSSVVTMPKSQVPTNASLDSKRRWLSGFLDALGVTLGSAGEKRVAFRDHEFIKEAGNLVLSCGLQCKLDLWGRDDGAICFAARDARDLARFLREGAVPDGRLEVDVPGGGTFRVLARAAAAVWRAARESGRPAAVESVVSGGPPRDVYSCGGAMAI